MIGRKRSRWDAREEVRFISLHFREIRAKKGNRWRIWSLQCRDVVDVSWSKHRKILLLFFLTYNHVIIIFNTVLSPDKMQYPWDTSNDAGARRSGTLILRLPLTIDKRPTITSNAERRRVYAVVDYRRYRERVPKTWATFAGSAIASALQGSGRHSRDPLSRACYRDPDDIREDPSPDPSHLFVALATSPGITATATAAASPTAASSLCAAGFLKKNRARTIASRTAYGRTTGEH